VGCKENRITGCIRLFIKTFYHHHHIGCIISFLKRIPIAFIILSRQHCILHCYVSPYLSTSLLQQISSSSTDQNFFQVSLCFYCERFFPSSHALPCTAWVFLASPCWSLCFWNAAPNQPRTCCDGAVPKYQSTSVPDSGWLSPIY
jgi:hypothetical protein